jgi:hypothetical protein
VVTLDDAIYISSINYYVLVNFEKVGPIYPGRGLGRGTLSLLISLSWSLKD